MGLSSSQIAVIGGASCDDRVRELAFATGHAIAAAGAVLLCGGRGGVMAAAAEGARSAKGRTVGILPGANSEESPPNPFIDIAIFTGMGQARNQVLVLSAEAVIGIGGGWGTLTEIGLARKHEIPVVLLESWDLERPNGMTDPDLLQADTAEQAVEMALAAIGQKGTR
jgi:uncharacterized protein (TIGR00725 family)